MKKLFLLVLTILLLAGCAAEQSDALPEDPDVSPAPAAETKQEEALPAPLPDETAASEPEDYAFTAKIFRTNGYHSDAEYPQVTLVKSKQALEQYLQSAKELYALGEDFSAAIAAYDDDWFSSNQLIFVLLEEGSGSIRHTVTRVTRTPEPLIQIDRDVPEVGTADMAEWHILVALPNIFEPDESIQVVFTQGHPEPIATGEPCEQ